MIAGLLGWVVAAVVGAFVFGRTAEAVKRRPEPDFLRDQPVDVLAPAEIARHIAIYEREMAA